MYDPTSATWAEAAPMSWKRMSFAAAALGGKIYAAGGIDALGNSLASVEVRGYYFPY